MSGDGWSAEFSGQTLLYEWHQFGADLSVACIDGYPSTRSRGYVDTGASVVRRWSRAGKTTSLVIKDCLKPVALCLDQRSGDQLVADGSLQRQQIRRYKAATAAYVAGADFGSSVYH